MRVNEILDSLNENLNQIIDIEGNLIIENNEMKQWYISEDGFDSNSRLEVPLPDLSKEIIAYQQGEIPSPLTQFYVSTLPRIPSKLEKFRTLKVRIRGRLNKSSGEFQASIKSIEYLEVMFETQTFYFAKNDMLSMSDIVFSVKSEISVDQLLNDKQKFNSQIYRINGYIVGNINQPYLVNIYERDVKSDKILLTYNEDVWNKFHLPLCRLINSNSPVAYVYKAQIVGRPN